MTDFFIPKKTTTDHWYKEPWMLLVLGGPAIVVVAACITFYLAWQGSDKIITKDYYKQGININKDIERDAKAVEYKMQAKLMLDSTSGKISLNLEGNTALPSAISLDISAASGASVYESAYKVTLSQMQPGKYEGKLNISPAVDKLNLMLWHVQIEAADWRLTADWHDPMHTALQLKQ